MTLQRLGGGSPPSLLFYAQTSLCAAGVLIALFAFLGGTPLFSFGFWPVNTAPLVFFRLGAAVAALGLALGFLGRPRAVIWLPASSIGLALLGACALLLSLSHPSMGMSFLGSPTFGDGAIWWVCAAALAGAAGRLAYTRPGRLFLAGAAVSAVAVEGNLHAGVLLPGRFAPYGFFQVIVWSMISAAIITQMAARDGRLGMGLALISVFVFFPIYFNFHFGNAAIGLFSASIFIFIFHFYIYKNPLFIKALSFFCAIVILAIPLAFQFEIYTLTKDDVRYLLRGTFHRVEYWQLLGNDIDFSEISAWLGHGWGGFKDVVFRQFLSLDQFASYSGEKWSPNLFDRAGVSIHSHNFLFEAIHGGGAVFHLLIAVLAIYFIISLPAWRAWLFVVMLAYGSFWYLIPANAGPAAIALGALSARRVISISRRWAIAACAAAAALAVFAAVIGGWRSELLRSVGEHVHDGENASEVIDRLVTIDPVGDHFQDAFAMGLSALSEDGSEESGVDPAVGWRNLEHLWREARKRIAEGDVLDRTVLWELVARGNVLDSDSSVAPPSDDFRDWIRDGWFDAAFDATAEHPARQDLLVFPLVDHVVASRWAALRHDARRLVVRDPQSAVGLWFLGFAEIQRDEETEQGFQRMARALDLGIGRFYPVSEEVADAVRRAAAETRR